jgi:protease-4
MSVESEMLVERREAGRRLAMWRMAAIVIGLLALLLILPRGEGGEGGKANISSAHIARLHISGMILDDQRQQKLLEKLTLSKKVKAVILRINSPGGTTVGGEALYNAIRRMAEKKPVVAVFGTVAASAAYMAAMGADRIITRGGTITGSIGVIVQWPDMSRMLDKIGVSMEELKSGSLKAEPSPFHKADEKKLGPMREMVEDTFKWFVELVGKSRKINPADIPGLVEGRIFSGREAVRLGLADEIGGEREAVKWLEKVKKIKSGLPVIERKPERKGVFIPLGSAIASLLRNMGLESVARLFFQGFQHGDMNSAGPGLMSIWSLHGGWG